MGRLNRTFLLEACAFQGEEVIQGLADRGLAVGRKECEDSLRTGWGWRMM